jgi:hypothetical protein
MIKSYNGISLNELFISDLPGTTFGTVKGMIDHLKYEHVINDEELGMRINALLSRYYVSFTEVKLAGLKKRAENVLIKRIEYFPPRNSGIKGSRNKEAGLVVIYDKDNNTYVLSMNYPITIVKKAKPERRFIPEDPYGEEVWDTNEANQYPSINANRLSDAIVRNGLEVLKRTFFAVYKEDIELISPVKKFLIDHGFKIDPDNMQDHLFDNGVYFCFGFTDNYSREFTRWCKIENASNYKKYYDYLVTLTEFADIINDLYNNKIHFIKHEIYPLNKKYTYREDDPYGEEDWGDDINPENRLREMKNVDDKRYLYKDISFDDNVEYTYLKTNKLIDEFHWLYGQSDSEHLKKELEDILLDRRVKYFYYTYDPDNQFEPKIEIITNIRVEKNRWGDFDWWETRIFLNGDRIFLGRDLRIINKREISERDPYGEEDWTSEGVKLDNVIKIVRLDTLYDKYKFHINRYKYIEKELSKYIGMYVSIKAWFSNPQKLNDISLGRSNEYLLLNAVYSNEKFSEYPMVFIDLGDENGPSYSEFPVNDNLVLYVREALRIITPEDPYGEEDWAVESNGYLSIDDLQKGDKVRSRMSGNVGFVRAVIHGRKWPVLVDWPGNWSQYCDPSDLEIYEGPKQIFSDADPYGEEDWIDHITEAITKIPQKVYTPLFPIRYVNSVNAKEISEGLKDIIGKNITFTYWEMDPSATWKQRIENDVILENVSSEEYKIFLHYTKKVKIGTMSNTGEPVIRDVKMKKILDEHNPIYIIEIKDKIYNTEDPYGEEDWGETSESMKSTGIINIKDLIKPKGKKKPSIQRIKTIVGELKRLIKGTEIEIEVFDRELHWGQAVYKRVHVLVKNISYDQGFLFITDYNDKVYTAREIIVPHRIVSELDPYGEEIWED